MNSLLGNIVSIEVSGSLSLVAVQVGPKTVIKSVVVETPSTAPHLQIGGDIKVLFKETEVIIGVGKQSNISLQNQVAGTVKHIDKGAILGKIVLETSVGEITSIISAKAIEELGLAKNIPAVALIKLNEVMLAKT